MSAPNHDYVRNQSISVIITTHNRVRLLGAAIESVLLSPLIMSPRQVVVVDDDSQDETDELASRFGVRYLRIAEHNISRSRNAGLALAETPYVTFLDDDDVWLPGNMEDQLAALECHPDAAFAYGIAQCASEDLEPLFPQSFPVPPLPSGLVPDGLHRSGYPQLGVVLFRREALTEVGGSDPRILYHQDGDLMMRIAAHREIVGVEVVGMLHRVRPPSMARSDYHWAKARREVTRWRPKHLRWTTTAKFRLQTRGLYCWRFWDDAAACLAIGRRRDALRCLWRALRISPAHAFHYRRLLGSIFWQSITARPAPQSVVGHQPG